MNFHWTKEPFGFCLRDGRGYARAIISTPGPRCGFFCQVITANMPESGPYKARQDAANWVAAIMVRLELVPPDSTFGALPIDARAAA